MKHRFFLKNNEFDKDIQNQIINVLKLKTGEEVEVCINNECFLTSLIVEKKNVSYNIISKIKENKTLKIDLIQGIPSKQHKIEFIIKYCSLYGVENIIFTNFKRSTFKVPFKDLKVDRYEKIIKESSEIAHRDNLTNISFINNLKDCNLKNYDLVILLDEQAIGYEISNIKKEDIIDKKIAIIIGPEGGISDIEREYIKEFNPIQTLILPFILTTESASLGVINYLYIISKKTN